MPFGSSIIPSLSTATASPIPILILPNFFQVKLSPSNHTLWKSQIMTLLKSSDLLGYEEGTKQCPSQFLPADGKGNKKINLDYILKHQQELLPLLKVSMPKLWAYPHPMKLATIEQSFSNQFWVELTCFMQSNTHAALHALI